MLKPFTSAFALLVVLLLFSAPSRAQTEIAQDYSRLLNIPDISTIQASTSHLYVLSASEGMAVFRVYEDSLQWLYTSSGMQRRGYKIEADIRFAYLYGDSRRLTVLEPTSVLGVYSSTQLPTPPLGVARLKNNLFIALGTEGLGQLSLETPETVDTEPEIVGNNDIGRADVLDVASSIMSGQLFVLTNDQRIAVFTLGDNGIELEATVALNKQIHNIFLDNELIWGTTRTGDVYEVNGNGLGRMIGSIGESPADLVHWKNRLFVRGRSGRIWVSENKRSFQLWKSDGQANHHLAKSGNTVWMNVYNKLSPLTIGNPGSEQASASTELKLRPINNIVLTYPKPLLLGVELIGNYPASDVEFTYRGNVTNASIRKQGFYWQPGVNQVGYNRFTIIAANSEGQVDSVSFTVDVRTFNSPPRFSPVRSSSIVVNDPYELKFNAVDPENPANSLIRYLGVDLPDGSTLDERTGLFKWTPTERNVGEVTFRIIATDEQGAAASQDVTLKVIDVSRDGE